MASGDKPLQAFSNATVGNDPDSDVTMILAYRQDGQPRLATYNANGDRRVQDDVERVQCGSMKAGYHDLTERHLRAFSSIGDSPQRTLVQALGLLQSYGIHDYLIEHGVGGGFCGLYLDQDGIHWQPDILYVVVHPQLADFGFVGSFARNNIWCLFSSMTTAGGLVFAHMKEDESGELYRQRVSPIVRALEEKNDRGEFDFITVLSTGQHVVSVIEMLGRLEHALLMVEPVSEVPGRLGIYWSPQLQSLLDRIIEPEGYSGPPHDMTVSFRPYRLPTETLVPEFRAELRTGWEGRQVADGNAVE